MNTIKTCMAFLFLAFIINTGCKKDTPAPDPTPAPQPVDPFIYSADLSSSKDVSAAAYALFDVDMMCGFLGERTLLHFYVAKPSAAPANTSAAIVDTLSRSMLMAFNQSPGIDGRKRDGSVIFNYAYDFDTNRDAKTDGKYYRNYGFSAAVQFYSYKTENWQVELADPVKPANIINRVSSANFNPATENLSWEMRGKFRISNTTSSGKDIICEAKFTKTLTNTNDPAVFNPSKQHAINWQLAKVAYTGTITGTIGDKAFSYTIDPSKPLFRNFNCNVVPSGSTEVTQFHPVIKGSGTLTWDNYHPRIIDHGPLEVCDNSGTVTFKGETYTVDFD